MGVAGDCEGGLWPPAPRSWVGDGEGAGLMELEECPSECNEPVDWYIVDLCVEEKPVSKFAIFLRYATRELHDEKLLLVKPQTLLTIYLRINIFEVHIFHCLLMNSSNNVLLARWR